MANTEIIKKAGDFVYELLKAKLPQNYVFHDYNHTLDVVKACKEIGKKTGLDDDEMEIVLLAAWFHDTGYTEVYEGHEEKSVEIAEKFLRENNFPENKIEQVKGCIRATKYPQTPKNILEEVVCDADLAHIAMDDYLDKSDLLRVEWEKSANRTFSELDWLKHEIDFFSHHRFFTKYAKKEFEENKIAHLLKIQKRYRKKLEQKEDEQQKAARLEVEKEKLASKKEAGKSAERGVDTMFRNVIRTHVEFSAMADHKANIMLTLNTLIIGAIVTTLIRKLEDFPYLTIPTFILLTVGLVAMIFAVLVTRPKISAGKFTKDEIHQKKANLLFFGNFHQMGLSDFEWGMTEMMTDREYLYGSMVRDFYFLGQVLGRKYRYLRICYNIFMFGIIISVLSFAIAFLFHPETPPKIELLQK